MSYLIRPRKFGRLYRVTRLPALRPQRRLIHIQKLESPLAPAADKREALRDKALQASYDEYKELTGAWRDLDTKAQGNIAVAGIFIAAAFTYLTKFIPAGLAEAVMLLFTVLLLVVSVLLSVRVLRGRARPIHYLGNFMRRQVSHLEGESDEEFRASLPLFYRMHAELWSNSSEQLIAALKRQDKFLRAAQLFLSGAILSAAVLVIFKLFTSGWGAGAAR